VIAGALVVIVGGAFAYRMLRAWRTHVPAPAAIPVSITEPTVPRWLDGALIPMATGQPAAVAVVIDNAPEARPPVGLTAAPLVFEVPMEGRRTRFLAIYPLPLLSAARAGGALVGYEGPIGPVRSARPYLVGLADAIGSPLVHVGGSNAALSLLKTRRHVNQYFDPPFQRTHTRRAPFNVFTSIAGLAAFVESRGWIGGSPSRPLAPPAPLWSFSDRVENTLTADSGSTIHLPFSRGERAFVVDWIYDDASGRYTRSEGGVTLRDAAAVPVTAKNVVTLAVRSEVLDAIGRLRIPAIEPPIGPPVEPFTTADAVVFRGGQRIDGRWGWKDGPPDAGVFGLRQKSLPIPLAPGTTWVELVDFDIGR